MTKLLDSPVELFFVTFLVLYVAVEVGHRRIVLGRMADDDLKHDLIDDTRNEIAVLLSLLLGFTLAMALPRYDQRRQLVVDEANAIGSTMLRSEFLSEPERSQVQQLLRDYAQARLDFGQWGKDAAQVFEAQQRSKAVQQQLWQDAVVVSQKAPTPITALFVQALNETIDSDEKRVAAFENRIPQSIWIMLGVIALLTCLIVGYGHRERFLLSMLVPPLMIAVVMSLIADLDTPRSGLIRISQRSMERIQSDLNGSSSTR